VVPLYLHDNMRTGKREPRHLKREINQASMEAQLNQKFQFAAEYIKVRVNACPPQVNPRHHETTLQKIYAGSELTKRIMNPLQLVTTIKYLEEP